MAKPSTRFIGGLLRLQAKSFGLNPSKPSCTSPGSFSRYSSSSLNDALNPCPQSVIFARSHLSNGFSATSGLIPLSHSKQFLQQLLPKSNFSNVGFFLLPKGPNPSNFSRNHSSKPSALPLFLYAKHHLSGAEGNLKLLPSAFFSRGVSSNGFWVRRFSSRVSGASKAGWSSGKSAIDRPISAVRSTLSRYQGAIGLQIDGFWKRNYLALLGAGAVILCAFLWRIMFGIASTFVGLSEGMAKYGFLALSAAMVAFAGLYLRSRFKINPDRVYRMAMRKLNTSAGILEVMGAPLSGTDLRAYVMSGGGVTLKNFRPSLRSKRCFLIFPIRGSERKGLVSVEVRKKKGQYDMKLLAVDIPMASGRDQRLFLLGDEEEYSVGGGLISELRDPVVKAMAATKEFEDLDEIEDEQDAEKELQEAERKHQEEMEALEKASGKADLPSSLTKRHVMGSGLRDTDAT